MHNCSTRSPRCNFGRAVFVDSSTHRKRHPIIFCLFFCVFLLLFAGSCQDLEQYSRREPKEESRREEAKLWELPLSKMGPMTRPCFAGKNWSWKSLSGRRLGGLNTVFEALDLTVIRFSSSANVFQASGRTISFCYILPITCLVQAS